MPNVRLKAGHVQPVWAGHPWVYAQAVDRVEGGALAGDEVDVVDPRGNFLGRGFYSPKSAIVVRILSRTKDAKIDTAFFRQRIRRAIALRRDVGLPNDATNGHRLVHAEGDGLPGLIIDRFDDVVALQFLTIGMKRHEGAVLEALRDELGPRAIVDRTPEATAKAEGFPPVSGSPVLRGAEVRELVFRERGFRYRVSLDVGHKTGYYFDQRPLRTRIEELARGRRVLDTYCFLGSISMAAARGGATHVLAVDESAVALEMGAECAKENGLASVITFEKRDARKTLADVGVDGGMDLVIVDPPRLAPTRANRDNALVAYAKLAELGCRATRPGGLLVFCSCSGAVDLQSLTRALAMGAMRANVSAVVLERLFQGADHPVVAAFPEGLYLKCLIARIDSR